MKKKFNPGAAVGYLSRVEIALGWRTEYGASGRRLPGTLRSWIFARFKMTPNALHIRRTKRELDVLFAQR